jgi:hypothetical protein
MFGQLVGTTEGLVLCRFLAVNPSAIDAQPPAHSNEAIAAASKPAQNVLNGVPETVVSGGCPRSEPGPGVVLNDKKYFLSKEIFDSNENIDAAIKSKYGQAARIADWNDISVLTERADIERFANAVGLVLQTGRHDCFNVFVSVQGTISPDGINRYFIARHDGVVPENWQPVGKIGADYIDLGRWIYPSPALLAVPVEGQIISQDKIDPAAQPEIVTQPRRLAESRPDFIQGSRAEADAHGPQFEAIRSLVGWIDTSMMSVPDVKKAFSDCQNTLLGAENDVLAKVDAAIQKETSRTTQQQLITLRDHAASVKEAHARAGCLKRLLIPIMLDMNGMGQNTQGNQRCCGDMDQIVLMDGGFLIERLRSRLADLTGVGFSQYLAKLSISDQRPEIVVIGNGDTKNCFMTKLFATPNMFGNYGSVTGGMNCHGKLEDALVEIAKEIP